MSDYAMQAEAEMWDAIAAQDDAEAMRRHEERRQAEEVERFADEYEGGQLGLAVPGEQRSLLPRPLPQRCGLHDVYGCRSSLCRTEVDG